MKIITCAATILVIAFYATQFSLPKAAAATYSTKVECLSIPITITATAPSSVAAGSTFSVTNVSSTTTVPSGMTVTKIESTSSLSNASPGLISGVWAGSGTNTFTANFPNLSLTATGAAGSQIALEISNIVVTVNGAAISCSAGGTLTANGPGESFTVFSIGITKPTTAGSSTTAAPLTISGSPVTSASHPTASSPNQTSSQPAGSSSNTSKSTTTDKTAANSTDLSLTVLNPDGKPQSGAKVSLDNYIVGTTDSKGRLTLRAITTGKHKLSVSYGDATVSQQIVANPNQATQNLTVKLSNAASVGKVLFSTFGILVLIFVAIIGFYTWRRRQTFHTDDTGIVTMPSIADQPQLQPSITPQANPVVAPLSPTVIAPTNPTPSQANPTPSTEPTTQPVTKSAPTSFSKPKTPVVQAPGQIIRPSNPV